MKLSLKAFFLNEGDVEDNDNVVDMFDFKRKKAQNKPRGFLASRDGVMLFHPDDFCFVVIDSDAQGAAVGDGDLKEAVKLGAKTYEISYGKDLDLNDGNNPSPETA